MDDTSRLASVNVTDVFNIRTAETSPVVFLAGMIAASAGTGGGVVYSAIFQAISGLSAHDAIPLALFMAFGTSIGSVMFLLPARHPLIDRPIIDFRLALVLEAPTLLGALIGVVLNVIFPDYIVFSFVVGFLLLSGWRALVQFRIQFRKERQDAHNGAENGSVSSSIQTMYAPLPQAVTELSPAAREMVEKERRFPVFTILALVLMWTGVTVLAAMRGGGGQPSVVGVACGGIAFYLLFAAGVLFLLLVVVLVTIFVGREYKIRLAAGFPFGEDIRWTLRNLLMWPSLFLCIGLLAGFVGVGGGLLQGPLLMQMGVHPRVAASTTAFLVLFTTSSSTVQFLSFGKLSNWALGLWYFGLGMVAAFLGQVFISRLVAYLGRPSIIILAISVIIVVSLASLCIISLPGVIRDFYTSFGSSCHPAGPAATTRFLYSLLQ